MAHPKKRKYSFHTRFIAIISIAIPLFILGWVGILESVQKGMEREMREGLTFTINLDKEMEGEKAEALSQELAQHKYIKEVRYISPAEAAKELEEELGENPELVLGHNPLLPSIELHLKAEYTDPDSLPLVDAYIASINGVDQLSYRLDMFSTVDKRMTKVSYLLLLLIGLLLLMAIVQVNNTTHLMIYTKRFLIRSMTLVGAKFGFICRPFLLYSLMNGLWGGCIAVALLLASLWGADRYMQQATSYISNLHCAVVMIALPLLGMLLSLITALFATRRYIRMDGGRMVLS